MRTVFIALFISSFYNPVYVKGGDEKRILLNDAGNIQSLLHQYETQLNKYGNALQEVQVKMKTMEDENAKLKRENENLNASLASLRMENINLNKSVIKFHSRLSALETNSTASAVPIKSICSFFVSLSNDLHLHKGFTVVFDRVFLNENSCYNNGDGVFVASVDGLYIFLWKITAHSGGYGAVYIKKNGINVGTSLLVKSNDDDLNHNSVSNFAILRLKKGDHVYLATSLDDVFIHESHSGFAGFYLRK